MRRAPSKYNHFVYLWSNEMNYAGGMSNEPLITALITIVLLLINLVI